MYSYILILLGVAIVIAIVVLKCNKSPVMKEGYLAPVQAMAKKIPYTPLPDQRQRREGIVTPNASTVPRMTRDYCSYVCETNEQYCRTRAGHQSDPFYCAQSRERCEQECDMNQHFMT